MEAHTFVVLERPDLVLLDLTLADAEYGWRVLDHLTLDPSTRRTPVILWPDAHEALRARAPALLPEHGIFVLTKPFEFETLLATVEAALKQYPPLPRRDGQGGSVDVLTHDASNPLTVREQEVARLIARGYSNRQVADALVLTAGTVANHVAHILDKLDCSSRLQIATWTLEGGSTNRAGDHEAPNHLLA